MSTLDEFGFRTNKNIKRHSITKAEKWTNEDKLNMALGLLQI